MEQVMTRCMVKTVCIKKNKNLTIDNLQPSTKCFAQGVQLID